MLELFITFFKIGLFTFGGGYAMISVIEDICVRGRKWITHDEMMNLTVIAESTPGPIAINCATFVGYQKRGLPGALSATLGVITPSFLVILLIARFLDNFLEIPLIANAFRGIKIAVGVLILDAALRMLRKMKKDLLSVLIFVCAAAVMLLADFFAWHLSTIGMLLVAAAISLAVFTVREHRSAGTKTDDETREGGDD